MRLDKFICKSTELNKVDAIKLIHDGRITVNGLNITQEQTQVHENNTILLDGEVLSPRPFRYIMMHKQPNTICSNIDEVYPSLFSTMDIEKISELHIAGRLDADTTGMVLITDDGRWSYKITSPTMKCEKVYRVGLSRDIAPDATDKFMQGILLQGESAPTRPAKLEIITPRDVKLTITEGKFHQVKRMFSATGNRVLQLKREKIGELTLDIEAGEWRYLTEDEVAAFLK